MTRSIDYITFINNYLATVKKEDRYYYISGKWFKDKREIKNIVSEIINSEEFKNEYIRGSFFGDIRNISEINEWLENYKALAIENVDPFGDWFLSKYQNLDNVFNFFKDIKKDDILEIWKNLLYKPNQKEMCIIKHMLYEPAKEIIYLIYGCGGSGKSTFLNLIKQLFENDVSSCSIDDLSNEFQLAEAVKHRLIMSDEINSDNFNNGKLKILASHQFLNCNPKNKQPFELKTQSLLIFSTNKVPKLDISDSGMLRRILYYSKNKKVDKPNPKLNNYVFKNEELYAIAYIASMIKEDLSIFDEETHEILISNNSVYLSHAEKYEDYKDYCSKKGYKSYNELNFYKVKEVFESWEPKL